MNEVEVYEDLGPAMLALNERQRRFVKVWNDFPTLRQWQYAKAAGYEGNNLVLRQAGFRLSHDEKVIAAINEDIGKRMRGRGPALGMATIMRIASTDGHKDQLRAAEALLNRTGFQETSEHKITVEHTDRTADTVIERIKELAARLGLDPVKLIGMSQPEAVDAEFEVVGAKNT